MRCESTFLRVFAVLASGVLFAAACVSETEDGEPAGGGESVEQTEIDEPVADPQTSDPSNEAGNDGEETNSSEPAALTASDHGVSETTITIGVPSIDIEQLIEFGILEESALDERAAWESAVANVNDRGGIHGRMLELVFVDYLPLGQASADAACVELVEDNEIFLAVGTLLVPEAVLCFTELNGTPFIGTSGSLTAEILERSDELALSTNPHVFDLRVALYDHAESVGALDLPLVVHGADQGVIEDAVSALEARGANVVSITTVSAPETDVQARAAEYEGVFERWRSDGAEAVISVDTSLDVVAAMGRQEFYIDVYSADGGGVVYGPEEERQFEAARHLTMIAGASWRTSEDHEPTRKCNDAWDARHPDVPLSDPDNGAQLVPVGVTCATIEMFSAIAEIAGPDLTHESLKAAVDGANGVDLPFIGPVRLGSDNPSATTDAEITTWDEDQGIFAASGTIGLG